MTWQEHLRHWVNLRHGYLTIYTRLLMEFPDLNPAEYRAEYERMVAEREAPLLDAIKSHVDRVQAGGGSLRERIAARKSGA